MSIFKNMFAMDFDQNITNGYIVIVKLLRVNWLF